MDPYGYDDGTDETAANLVAAMSAIPLRQQQILARQKRAQGLIGTPTPQGREVGRTFVASSPLEHLSVALSRAMGYRDAKAAEADMGPLADQAQQAGLAQFRQAHAPAPVGWGAPAGMTRSEALKIMPEVLKSHAEKPADAPADFMLLNDLSSSGKDDMGMLANLTGKQAWDLKMERQKEQARADLKSFGEENVHFINEPGVGNRWYSGSGRVYEATPEGGIGRQISGPPQARTPAPRSAPASAGGAAAPASAHGSSPGVAPGPRAPRVSSTKVGMTEDGYPIPRNIAEQDALAIARGDKPPPSPQQLYGRNGTMLSGALTRYKVNLPEKQALFEQFKGDAASYRKQVQLLDLTKAWETTGNKNLDVLEQTSREIASAGGPWVNKPLRAIFEGGLGDPKIQAFKAAHAAVVNEFAKILAGNTGSAGVTEGARREAESMLPLNATPQQIAAAAAILRTDARNRLAALEGQLDETKKRLSTGMKTPSANAASGASDLRAKYGL